MPQSPGSRFGPYEIVASLGAGGMGEVYRARDPRLGREVAVKVLSPDSVKDVDRRRRFETEARAVSALNHPNIVSVFDVGVEDGAPYLVTELVPGESLREVLRRGAVPLKKLLDIAAQAADGLAAAHRAGIVHRDIKPENLMVTQEGRVKILDFGLARAGAASSADLPTLTQAGVVMGTVAYMSPEQARGEVADNRADQFSLGLVIHEMVTGKKAFDRPTSAETMAAILKEDAPPLDAPAPLCWLVERCLAKDSGERYAATADLAADLKNLRDRSGAVRATVAAPAARPHRGFSPGLAAVFLAVGAVAAFLTVRWLTRPLPSTLRYRPFVNETGSERSPAWSPDGKTIAYLREVGGVMQVFTKALTSDTAAQITRTTRGCHNFFWAPDGKRIYYVSGGSLWSVGAAGGPAQVAIEAANFAAISPDGKTIAFTRGSVGNITLWIKIDSQTSPERYSAGAFERPLWTACCPAFSRDGRTLAMFAGLREEDPRGIWLAPVSGGSPRLAWVIARGVQEPASFCWMADGKGMLIAPRTPGPSGERLLKLDLATGNTAPLAPGIGIERFPAVSPNGSEVAFTAGAVDFDLVEGSLDGGHVETVLATSYHEADPDWSSDGSQIVFSGNAAGGGREPFLLNLQTGSRRQLIGSASDSGDERVRPRLSPDSGRIAYEQFGAGHTIWISPLAGGQQVRLEEESNDQHIAAWSPDGAWIAYRRQRQGKWEIAKAGGGGRPVRLSPTSIIGPGSGVNWAPDNRWIAFGDPDGIHVVSPDGLNARLLSPLRTALFAFVLDSRSILALARDPEGWWRLHRLDVGSGADKDLGRSGLPRYSPLQGFSLHPDGKRFATAAGTSREDIWILEGVAP